jgi:release factor glutamine methyltransferase
MTVLEVIQRSTEFLAKKGVESPRLQVELLLAHLLKLPRMQLYLKFERALTSAELDSLRELIQRRGRREPLQHIIGSTSFCGLEIAVNRSVLVPRPETELLAENGWSFLNELVTKKAEGAPVRASSAERAGEASALLRETEPSTSNLQPVTASDFGTGSGCVAIAVAVNSPAAEVYALEISPEALDLARKNASSLGLGDRIRFVQSDGFAGLTEQTRVDLILSNPPYVPSAEIATLQPEVRDYDPRAALDGGPDGLDFYRRLSAEAGRFLKPSGKIMVEFGDNQAQRVQELFEQQNWVVERIVDDYTQRPRIMIARLKYG